MSQPSCHSENTPTKPTACHGVNQTSCHQSPGRPDYLLIVSLSSVIFLYVMHVVFSPYAAELPWLPDLSSAVHELVNQMWWGVVLGILMIGVLGKIPREFVLSILGTDKHITGILRATAAGVLLDLCSHGILMVAAKLYERGANIGQVMAFLVASPWNSLSLTIILIALIGLGWTLLFILLSIVVAVITGLVFNRLVGKGALPANNHTIELDGDFQFWSEAKRGLKNVDYDTAFFTQILTSGIAGSRVVLRWLLFGILLASAIRVFVPLEYFHHYLGPTLLGLMVTVAAATIIEVCSEGSAPIAADVMNRAQAPGNSFAFLMTGVSTDYTEIMVLKDTTRSWKIALFLPLITVPQIIVLAWLLNTVT